METQKKGSGLAIFAMVCGIVGLLLSCLTVGIVPAIVGLVLGIVSLALKGGGRGMAIAGIVTSIIGIVIAALMIAGIAALPGALTNALADEAKKNGTTQEDTPKKEADVPKTPADTSEDTPAPADTAPAETILAVNEAGVILDWNVVVTNVQILDSVPNSYGAFTPKEGNKFILVSLSVTNNGQEAAVLLPSIGMGESLGSRVLYGDGLEFSATNLLGYSDELHNSTIEPLTTLDGTIAFEVPSSVADATDELILQIANNTNSLKFKLR